MSEPIVVSGSAASTGNRRVLILAVVAVVLLLAVVVLPGLLFGGGGGGSSVEDSFPPVSTPPTTVVPDGGDGAPAETSAAFTSKNPFDPLVEMAAPVVSAPSTSGEAVDTTATPDPLSPIDDPGFAFPIGGDGAVLPDDGTTATTLPPAPVRQPDRVALLEVYSDLGGRLVASVRINDATYGVGEGEEFAFSYRVLDLDLGTRCATLLFGDDRFGLCEGDETSK